MDSKIKSAVITICICTCVLIVLIAVSSNLKKTAKQPTVSNTESVEESISEIPSKQIGNNTSAWKNDETFFDSEADTLALKILQESMTLQVKAVSEQKDLRIRVLDSRGNVKSGESFVFSVNRKKRNPKQYTDEDCDGVVYIDSLEADEYEISLMPIGEYIVPDKATTVEVNDRIKYEKLEDIELLFATKTSAEVTLDDLMVVSAVGYSDKKQDTAFAKDDAVYGVDVSQNNGEIDWDKVYKAGIRFVMLRAGFRGAITGDIIIDEQFSDNATKAARAGLEVGAYFFSQAVTEKEAVEEASALLKCCEQKTITYPLAIRVDQAGGFGRADSLEADYRTEVAEAFLKTIENSGQQACIYASSNWLQTNLDAKKIEKYVVWMSQLSKTPTDEFVFDMWQYTTKGKVPGIDGEVSISRSYK